MGMVAYWTRGDGMRYAWQVVSKVRKCISLSLKADPGVACRGIEANVELDFCS